MADVTLSQACEHIETEQHIFEGLQTTVCLVSKYFLSCTTGAVVVGSGVYIFSGKS
jgi:hypothetical protein